MKYKLIKKGVVFALILGIIVNVLSGCGRKEIAFTTGLSKDELFKIEGKSCSMEEANVVLLNLQREYEGLFGSGNWDRKFADSTIGEYVKEQTVKQLSQIRVLSSLANKEGITLDKEEIDNVQNACDEYLNSIDSPVREKLKIDRKAVKDIYIQYCLANKYYQNIIESVDSEISDDEARIISVQYIYFNTKKTDENGKTVSISEQERNDLNTRLLNIMEKINAGEEFEQLAIDFSEDDNVFRELGRGESEPAFEKAAFNLTDGQVSEIVEADDGIYIIKCLNNFNEEATLENKKKIYERQCDKALNSAYDSYVSGVMSEFNYREWKKVELKNDEIVSSLPDLFGIYSRYLQTASVNLKLI